MPSRAKLHFEIPPAVKVSLERLGSHLRTARIRRRWTQADTADRCGISRETLRKAEQGDPGVSMGTYATLVWLFGLEEQWVAALSPRADRLGMALAESEARKRGRSRRGGDDDF